MHDKRVIVPIAILLIAICVAELIGLTELLPKRSLGVINQVPGQLIRQGAPESRQLSISCNVDWGEEVIPELLQLARKEKLKLTFFVTGRWAEAHPDLLLRMHLSGHEIQNHGYFHKLCSQIDVETSRQEIQKTEDAVYKIIGVRTTLFAPPSGDYDQKTLDLCMDMGYSVCLWSADTIDWKPGSTAAVIRERILSKPLEGAIVLMHPKPETLLALPGLLTEIRSRGIQIIKLSEMKLTR